MRDGRSAPYRRRSVDEIRSARRVLVFDAVVGLMFVAFVLIVTQRIANESGENYDAFAVVLIVACGASITIRRRMPDLALAISIIAIAIYTLRDYEGGPIYLAPLVPLYTLASLRERRELIVPVGSALLVLLGVGLAAPDRGKNIWYHIAFTSWAAAALFLGDGARTRRAYLLNSNNGRAILEESRDEEDAPPASPRNGCASPATSTTSSPTASPRSTSRPAPAADRDGPSGPGRGRARPAIKQVEQGSARRAAPDARRAPRRRRPDDR